MNKLIATLGAAALLCSAAACSDKDSYADLLTAENQSVNYFLSGYPVIDRIPEDSVFISVKQVMAEKGISREAAEMITPFYRMDDDGYVYMQLVNPDVEGKDLRPKTDQVIYFRATRWSLNTFRNNDMWKEAKEITADGMTLEVPDFVNWDNNGNSSDLASQATSIRYGNTSLTSTTQWGTGIQRPLDFFTTSCEVNMVIKSYVGPEDEITSVTPFLYKLRYFPSRI